MAMTPSKMVALGTPAPDFSLPDTDGNLVRLSDFEAAPALLVVFMCNHCPFVQHIREGLARLASRYMERGVAVVGINSNDAEKYPADSPEKMKLEKQSAGYPFPYLFDESQDVARQFGASCTPDFFLYDSSQELVYRGQMDDSRPGNTIPVTGADLNAAIEAVLNNQPVNIQQKASIGCNIKWRE